MGAVIWEREQAMFSRGENPSTVAPVGPTDSSSPPSWGDKRRGGRPVLPPERRRTRTITVSVHQEEWRVISEKAKAAGLCVSVYAREAALGTRLGMRVNAGVYRELSRIGVNMNQLARVANRTRCLPEERLLREAVEALLAMRRLL